MKHRTTFLARRTADVLLAVCAVALLLVLLCSIHDAPLFVAMVVGCGVALAIVAWGALNLQVDGTRSEATARTLRMASDTLEHLRGGLTVENARALCALLLPETRACGIAITDTAQVLAREGEVAPECLVGARIGGPTLEVVESRRMETFSAMGPGDGAEQKAPGLSPRRPAPGVIVPLAVKDRVMGTLKLYYHRDLDIDRTQLAIAEGLGMLLSTQLSSYELERQAELTARAEVKALQAQINPHFLFNALNTIASFTRTDPTKARDLLREFATFYRRTLESSERALIPLEQELEQTRRYLRIEKARFGEERIAEHEHVQAGCERLPVPSFLVQPIVENAVRHAMRDEGTLNVDVHVARDGDAILIAVVDDGLGMGQAEADRLLSASDDAPARPGSGRGTGMALRNVAERVKRFFGAGSGVEIVSRPGEGTCVTLRLADAATTLANLDAMEGR